MKNTEGESVNLSSNAWQKVGEAAQGCNLSSREAKAWLWSQPGLEQDLSQKATQAWRAGSVGQGCHA